jgi:hypothetical protein
MKKIDIWVIMKRSNLEYVSRRLESCSDLIIQLTHSTSRAEEKG